MIYPEKLKSEDKVAVITPATVVKTEFIGSAAEFLRDNGLEPVVMPHAKGPADGSYAASLGGRLSDLLTAWQMPEVKGVLCARGGYGATHLLPHIPGALLRENPKWLIGFSDISALHAFSLSCGVASIHGPMARDFRADCAGGRAVIEMLKTGRMSELTFENTGGEALPENIAGEASGRLIGGNLAVLNGLAATPYDIFARAMEEDIILFLEDIAEPIYKIERVLYRLYMQGVFTRLRGLAVGRFTEYNADKNYPTVERMIEAFLADHDLKDFPVAYNLPVGHFPGNLPVMEGAEVTLRVTPTAANLSQE